MYASAVVIPPFVETTASHGYGFGASPALAGLFLLPQSMGMLVVGLFNGRITAAIGSKAALAIGGGLGGLAFGMLAAAHGPPWQFFVATAVMGLGTGLGYAAMSNLVVGAVPESQTGVATGMNANVRTIGGAIGSQLVATILASGVALGAFPAPSARYVISYLVLGAAFLLAGVAALAIPGARGSPGRRPRQLTGRRGPPRSPPPLDDPRAGHRIGPTLRLGGDDARLGVHGRKGRPGRHQCRLRDRRRRRRTTSRRATAPGPSSARTMDYWAGEAPDGATPATNGQALGRAGLSGC